MLKLEIPMDLVSDSGSIPPASEDSPLSGSQPVGAVVNYADFQGARGRDVFFRPDRYQVSDLGPIGVAVELDLYGELHQRELYDVSQNGIAFDWPAELAVEVGAILPDVIVKF